MFRVSGKVVRIDLHFRDEPTYKNFVTMRSSKAELQMCDKIFWVFCDHLMLLSDFEPYGIIFMTVWCLLSYIL